VLVAKSHHFVDCVEDFAAPSLRGLFRFARSQAHNAFHVNGIFSFIVEVVSRGPDMVDGVVVQETTVPEIHILELEVGQVGRRCRSRKCGVTNRDLRKVGTFTELFRSLAS
jgi:hypothetical protein